MQDKVKKAEYNKRYRDTHREEIKKYNENHKEEIKKYLRRYNKIHRERLKKLKKEYNSLHKNEQKETKKLNKDKINEQDRNRMKNFRFQVLSYYSKGELKCACCNENHYEFLTIDHINNDGAEHKRKIGIRRLYQWLVKNNFPEGFQVLCYNCNLCKGYYGECYHKNPEIKGKKNWSAKRRFKVLSYYSPELKCACCGESIYHFLSIDHIYGGGLKHYNKIGYIYSWLIDNNFPEDFRVLCYNCNCSLGHQGYCPHHPEIKQIQDKSFVYGKKDEMDEN